MLRALVTCPSFPEMLPRHLKPSTTPFPSTRDQAVPAAGVGRASPVEVLEALLIVQCSAHLAGVSVLKLDPIEPQHKLVGLNKPLSDLLAAFKCLGSTRRRAGSSGDIAATDVGLLGAPLSPIHLEAWTHTQVK